jgi:beta-galactosidase
MNNRRTIFCFDHFENPKYHRTIKLTDLKEWHDISPELSFPKGVRHGTVLRVPESLTRNLSVSHTSQPTKQP